MTAPQLTLTRVVIRGSGLPNDTANLGGVGYYRESGGPTAIYFTTDKPRFGSDVHYPARDDARMKITLMPGVVNNRVGVEFCGSDVDLMVAAAGAQETVAGAVGQIAPLLRYFQENFRV